MPPIINSNHSKITLDTTDVFIDITATDKTKLEIVSQILVAMFSPYCSEPYTIEPVRIISPHNNETRESPDLKPRPSQASAKFINSVCGLELSREEICKMLSKMCYTAKPSEADSDKLDVDIPITRADVLHQADIMEDVAIGYGFNNLPRNFPSTSNSVAAALPINKLADIVRVESAMAGWSEVMPLILCSHDENYAWLNKKDDGRAVRLQNPKALEYQIVRTSIQARYLSVHPVILGPTYVLAILAIQGLGYYIFRSANNEKNRFRTNPNDPKVAHLKYIETAAGSRLLTSGWWGTARHINYLGDWLMSWSYCLPTLAAGYKLTPSILYPGTSLVSQEGIKGYAIPITYFYMLYFAVLLIHREMRDEEKCRRKYGKDWEKYCEIVRWRIWPGVY